MTFGRRAAFVEFKDEEIEQSLAGRFEQQAAAHRHRLAVKTRAQSLTYETLNQFANAIAAEILARGDERASPVALLLEQGAPLIASIIGALKAGRIYVPLDPSHPPSRLSAMLEDAQVGLLLTDHVHLALGEQLTHSGRPPLNLDVIHPGRSVANPRVDVLPDALAYLFYTSGSTGRPKGVADTQRNVLHNIMRYTNSLQIGADDRLTLVQSCSFSGSVSSLFGALLNGASVFPLNLSAEGTDGLSSWLVEEGITIYHSVPTIFRRVFPGTRRFPQLRLIRLEGDRATRGDVELYRKSLGPECLLVNGLGTTETGIVRQYFVDSTTELPEGIVPVGYPVKDMHVLLLDDAGREVGVGKVGEIAVQSNYLAPGYWRRPHLTSAAFLPDPAGSRARIYLTGDMGRLRRDGCLEYLGRKDSRTKIRGQTVEPAEVEQALLGISTVTDAVVAVHEGTPAEPRLVAFVVPSGSPPRPSALRQALAEALPDYMIPSRFVTMDALPLTADGKVDRRGLPAAGRGQPEPLTPYRAPRDALERQLVELWEEVLDVRPVGVRDSFYELGGDSLSAARMLSRVRKIAGGDPPLTLLSQATTIEQLAGILHPDADRLPLPSLVPLQRAGARRPLFLVHDLRGDVHLYHRLVGRLGDDQPVYGLQPGSPEDLCPPADVPRIAARYLAEIRRVHPEGSFGLGGFCFGGVVAFEMAHQLHARGQTVDPLALFGISPWDFPRLVSAAAWDKYRRHHRVGHTLLRRTMRDLTEVLRLDPREWRGYLGSRAAGVKMRLTGAGWNAVRLLYEGSGRPFPRSLWDVRRLCQHAFKSYEARTFPGRVTVFLSGTSAASYLGDPWSDWRRLAADVAVYKIPGDDHDMLREPHVETLSAYLRDCLHAAGAASVGGLSRW